MNNTIICATLELPCPQRLVKTKHDTLVFARAIVRASNKRRGRFAGIKSIFHLPFGERKSSRSKKKSGQARFAGYSYSVSVTSGNI